jgi:hypothetical protein
MILVRMAYDEAEDRLQAAIVILEVVFVIIDDVFTFVIIIMMVDVDHHDALGFCFSVFSGPFGKMHDSAVTGADIYKMDFDAHSRFATNIND